LLGQPAPAGGLVVTLASNSGQLLLANSATSAGSGAITVTVPAGQLAGVYFLQGAGNSGAPTYTVTAPGYPTKTGTITLASSGIVIAGPFGFGSPLTTTVAQGNQPVTVSTAVLDGSNNPIQTQQLAGGKSVSVVLNNSDSSVGTVTSPVTITGGNDSVNTPFHPVHTGSTVITVTQPTGFTTPGLFILLTATVN